MTAYEEYYDRFRDQVADFTTEELIEALEYRITTKPKPRDDQDRAFIEATLDELSER